MKNVESWVLSYLLNSAWQVPLLFAVGWLASRIVRATGIDLEHRIWAGVLLLQTALPACSTLPPVWFRRLAPWRYGALDPRAAHVSVIMGPGLAVSFQNLPEKLAVALAFAYGIATCFFLARLLWRNYALAAIRKDAVDVALTKQAALSWKQCTDRFAIKNASLVISSHLPGPATLGFSRKLVLLPPTILTGLSEAEFQSVLAHECAHISRDDFTKNLLYQFLSLPVRYHPFSRLTSERVVESREMLCDRLAADLLGREVYARSLLRLASVLLRQTSRSIHHAIGILDANAFERRIMQLTKEQKTIGGARQIAVAACCIAFGNGTCLSALSLGARVDTTAATDQSPAKDGSKPVLVSGGVMAGHILSRVNPEYPEAARRAGVQGTVVLAAIIGKEGRVENLQIVSGPKELQGSALDAVRQWTYKPFLLNGNPVEVKTTITVNYSVQP